MEGSTTTVADGSTTTTEASATTTEPDAATTTTAPGGSTTTVPDEPGAPGVRVEELDVEDCFSPVGDAAPLDTVRIVDCDEPHAMEVFDQYELDGEDLPGGGDGGYPGGSEITWAAQDECQSRFEDYVGEEYLESRFDMTTITPSFSTWDLGDRTVTCVVIAPGGGQLTGSAKGSDR